MKRPLEKRRGHPARGTLSIADAATNEQQDIAGQDDRARAARMISRRFALRLSIAAIIVDSCGIGGRA